MRSHRAANVLTCLFQSIYVSGGFGRNPMLRRRIRQYGTERGIHVYPADDDDLNTDTTFVQPRRHNLIFWSRALTCDSTI